MKRREFISLLGSAVAAWPLAARAQEAAMPVIGYLNLELPETDASWLTSLRRGLVETGYVESRNFVIEYRFTGNQAAAEWASSTASFAPEPRCQYLKSRPFRRIGASGRFSLRLANETG
jgi:hypothetical protein